MKKFFASILLVIYIAFTSGIVVNMHFCMNRFDSFKLGASQTDVCNKCGMHTKDASGCCHDDVRILKIQDDQLAGMADFHFVAPAMVQENQAPEWVPALATVQNRINQDHAPPINGQMICIQNCVFRI